MRARCAAARRGRTGPATARRVPARGRPAAASTDRAASRRPAGRTSAWPPANDGVGLFGLGDQADGAGRDAGVAPDPLGERHLVAGRRAGSSPARRCRRTSSRPGPRRAREGAAQAPPIARFPAALGPVGRRDPHEQRQSLRPHRCAPRRRPRGTGGRGCRTTRRTRRSRVLLERREELVNQISVRRVDLDDVEAGVERARALRAGRRRTIPRMSSCVMARGHRVVRRRTAQPSDAIGCQPPSSAGTLRRAVPGPARAALASGVRELDTGSAPCALTNRDDALERPDVVVVPDAEILRADAPLGASPRSPR